MFKLVFLLVVAVIGYIAYTGIDVTEEYDTISEVRDQVLDDVFDPLTKKVLKLATESNLDEIVETSTGKHTGEKNEM